MDTMTESNEDGSKCETVTDGQAEGNAETLNSNGDENAMDDIPEHLREFDVLDEVHGDSGSEADDRDEDGADSDYSEGEEIDIDNMLDEGLPEDLRERKKMYQYEEKSKLVLEEKGKNHFEVLPEGWIQVSHNSGLPIYMHKASRVCSISRPYFLGPGSLRKHQIPVSAIPCLSYRRALEEEKRLSEMANSMNGVETAPDQPTSTTGEAPTSTEPTATEPTTSEPTATEPTTTEPTTTEPITSEATTTEAMVDECDGEEKQNGEATTTQTENEAENPTDQPPPAKKPRLLGPLSNARIETVKENLKEQSLTIPQINDYCKSLFVFKNIRVMRFTSWSARRRFTKHKKTIRSLQRPTLPDGTKLITFPVMANDAEKDTNRGKKQHIMNPNGKSYICILHEYVQHALKKQPNYEFKELENAATPYSATVSINDLKYGTGFGSSKKQAKSEAARETLEILIPEMRDKIVAEKKTNPGAYGMQPYKDLSVFDEIRIEDPRVAEFCNKTTEPSPHAILTTCLQRNYGLGDIQIDYQVNTGRHKLNDFTMTVGKHKKTVICRNKREGKQIASQAILQILHPHIKTWGSLLRLYGNNSVKSFKEKKMEEQEITVLQSKAAINQPNYAILDKLKEEMTKLIKRREASQPIGKFIPPNEFNLPLASCSNLNNVEL